MSDLAGSFDLAFHRFVLSRPRPQSVEGDLGPGERIAALRALQRELTSDRRLEGGRDFFPEVPRIEPRVERVRAPRGTRAFDWRWPSSPALHFPEVEERWSRHPRNATAFARYISSADGADGPAGAAGRPAILLVHGYLAGNPRFEAKVWPTRWFIERGFDVVLPSLPFHGPRRRDKGPPPFPAADPRFTIEGFRQAMTDLSALVRFLRERGAPAVGAAGMSLGGYSVALLATVEPLDFVVPFIPLASIADFAREGGRFTGTSSQQRSQHQLLDRIHAPVSPLARRPLVPAAGRLVIAGRRDRITPLSHAERLAAHFEAPLSVFEGAHLLQVGRASSFRDMARMLGRMGLLE